MWYKLFLSAAVVWLTALRIVESASEVNETIKPSQFPQSQSNLIKTQHQDLLCGLEQNHPHSEGCFSSEDCPPWFYCNQSSHQCRCGSIPHNILQCSDAKPPSSTIRSSFCLTYNAEKKTTELGACLYSVPRFLPRKKDPYDVYTKLSGSIKNLSKLYMCDHLNRAGSLCGKCKRNHSPLVYSYKLDCVQCDNGNRKYLWKFLMEAFLPLTLFYFIVLFFKINVNTSHLRPFVLFSQCISQLSASRYVFLILGGNTITRIQFKFLVTIYGIWNLDFFRAIWPDICLNISPLSAIALDYAVAFYPLLLVVFSYVLIELHDHNYRPIVVIWKPFRYVLTMFRRNWDSHTSVIDAYATFFLLAFMKVLSVSCNLLTPVPLYKLTSNDTNFTSTTALFYDASVTYLSKEHLPYAVPAILILVCFVLFPTALLLLYPFSFFQKFLNCFPIRWHILHTFVDSFQGCYKDGTEPGTRDCRWFAALFLLIRMALFTIYCQTLSSLYFAVGAMFLTLVVMLLVLVQPFKEGVAHYAKIDLIFLQLLAGVHVGYAGGLAAGIVQQEFVLVFVALTSLLLHFPYLYLICTIIHWLFTRRKWGREQMQNFKAWMKGYCKITDSCCPDEMVPPLFGCNVEAQPEQSS